MPLQQTVCRQQVAVAAAAALSGSLRQTLLPSFQLKTSESPSGYRLLTLLTLIQPQQSFKKYISVSD
jgi:hypothetical protein